MKRTASVLVSAGLVLLWGCGTQTAVESAMGDSAAGTPTQTQSEIVANHQRWAGSSADLQAAEVLRAQALNGEFDACMQSAGYPEFNFRNNIHLPLAPPDTGLTGLLEPFGQHVLRDEALAAARGMALEYKGNHPETEYATWNDQVDAATDRCLSESSAASDGEIERLIQPAGLDGLLASWYRDAETQRLLLIGSGIPEARGYVACMGDAGFGHGSVKDGEEYAPSLMGRLRRLVSVPRQDSWRVVNDPEAREDSQLWQDFIAAEEAWLEADEKCRTGIVAGNIAQVKAHQDEFVAEHAQEIDQVAAGWAAIRKDARELGWTPGNPFAS